MTGIDLALTPPMGWNSWNQFDCNVTAALIESQAHALIASGMRDAGYTYMNIDDCWMRKQRDPVTGVLEADPERFPQGIKALADSLHAKGLKLGIYQTPGRATCQGRPGSEGFEELDAQTFAAWGIDFLKYDRCSTPRATLFARFEKMRDALRATGRPIVLSINPDGIAPPAGRHYREVAHQWRTTPDIKPIWTFPPNPSFRGFIDILDINTPATLTSIPGETPPQRLTPEVDIDFARHANRKAWKGVARPDFVGPGAWNDPDMLEVGVTNSPWIGPLRFPGLGENEAKAHFSLWSILAAPLIAGNDLTRMTATDKAILTNTEVIAVDQDPLGIQGYRTRPKAEREVFVKPLAQKGARAVVLLNRTGKASRMSVTWSEIGLADAPASVRDLWIHRDEGEFTGRFFATVPSHGVVMLRIVGTPLGR